MSLRDKIISFSQLEDLGKELREKRFCIVTTNGCFDLLHLGHLHYLEEARALGDVLICGINSDSSVKKIKGAGRPFHNSSVRAIQLAALESVSFVTIFEEDTPIEFIKRIKPDIHVKGGDYTAKDLIERNTVESLGGKLTIVKFIPGYSTTELIARIKNETPGK